MLILDEATGSVDTETEPEIREVLDRLVRGRTVFAIAHRLSTLRKASRLMVIEDGPGAAGGWAIVGSPGRRGAAGLGAALVSLV